MPKKILAPDELHYLMDICLSEAEKAYQQDEVPVGALVIDEMGKILSQAHNTREKDQNPCGHAEILAIQKAAHFKKSWRLNRCTLIVSLEPCPMCLASALQGRIQQIIFGAYDPKGGSISLGYHLYKDQRLNHNLSIIGGLRHYESSRLLSQFFKEKRTHYKNKRS